ncbi:MAG: hypothetical protein ABI678_16725 [Kofleriaceae bacterium]
MSHHPRFDPMPERTTEAALDLALRPFVDRFIDEERRARARTVLTQKHGRMDWSGVMPLLDIRRARVFETRDLEPWNAVRGVFLVDHDAFSIDAKTMASYYVPDPWMFVAYGATFAVVHEGHGQSLLYT